MCKVKLTITESKCRGGYCKKGDTYIVDDLCPPLCHELWNSIYPLVYALQNGATLDYGTERSKQFDAKCPDGGRVCIHGEMVR
ncbi:TIGR04076 family protein [Anaerosporobacter faecicola]|uniref:TIGR04076 family protein n=1 Tax=Anaerosporobacter faecicola TaxID=2718714 RepID=UPI00143C10D8|nr:TIGR04076 family protein [Anaerosporobacter faecicola]